MSDAETERLKEALKVERRLADDEGERVNSLYRRVHAAESKLGLAEAVIEAARDVVRAHVPGDITDRNLRDALAAADRALSTTQPHPFVASNEDFDTRCVVCGCKAHRAIHAALSTTPEEPRP